jgi:hypothetical protein
MAMQSFRWLTAAAILQLSVADFRVAWDMNHIYGREYFMMFFRDILWTICKGYFLVYILPFLWDTCGSKSSN